MRNHNTQPELRPFSGYDIPKVERLTLSNGTPLFIIDSGSQEVVRMEFIFNAGIVTEKKPLIASATNSMLMEGTLSHSARELNEIIDYHGAYIGTSFDSDHAGLVAVGLTRQFEKLVELSSEMLFTSSFPEDELSLYLTRRLQSFRIQSQKVSFIARAAFQEALFGPEHPYGKKIEEKSFTEISAEGLRDFHAHHYTPANMSIIASGKLPEDGVHILDKHIGAFMSNGTKVGTEQIGVTDHGPQTKYLKKDGSVQSAIKIGCRTINKFHSDYHGLKVVSTILGGYFGSRLMKSLREEKGFVYGISSGITSMVNSGMFVINCEVGSKYLEEAIPLIYKELEQIKQTPVSKEELDLVRNYLYGEILRLFDGPFTTAETFRSAYLFGHDLDYFKRMLTKVENITSDEIITLARTYLVKEEMSQIIAG